MPKLFEIAPARTGGRQTGGLLRPFLRLHGPCERAGADAFLLGGTTLEETYFINVSCIGHGIRLAARAGNRRR